MEEGTSWGFIRSIGSPGKILFGGKSLSIVPVNSATIFWSEIESAQRHWVFFREKGKDKFIWLSSLCEHSCLKAKLEGLIRLRDDFAYALYGPVKEVPIAIMLPHTPRCPEDHCQ